MYPADKPQTPHFSMIPEFFSNRKKPFPSDVMETAFLRARHSNA